MYIYIHVYIYIYTLYNDKIIQNSSTNKIGFPAIFFLPGQIIPFDMGAFPQAWSMMSLVAVICLTQSQCPGPTHGFTSQEGIPPKRLKLPSQKSTRHDLRTYTQIEKPWRNSTFSKSNIPPEPQIPQIRVTSINDGLADFNMFLGPGTSLLAFRWKIMRSWFDC